MLNFKCPRTFHLPWSPGKSSDDKSLTIDEVSNFINKVIVITEKLDGENNSMTRDGVYARSHSSFTTNPWSKNLWDPVSGLHKVIKDVIGFDEIIFGENLYGIHSIEYNKLTSYFHIFAVANDLEFYSWKDITDYSDILVNMYWDLEFQCVPELFTGKVSSIDELKSLIDKLMNEPSKYGDTKEGVVIRIAESFPIDQFKYNVCKYVRANHVQTDQHWTKNWKKAKLINGL